MVDGISESGSGGRAADPRLAAARLADRMAAEGYPWDAIREISAYEMLLGHELGEKAGIET